MLSLSSLSLHVVFVLCLIKNGQAAGAPTGCKITQAFTSATFSGPESMQYDAMNDFYFVSNNAGKYITRISPTTNAAFKLVQSVPGVPLGLAVSNATLYAAVGANVISYRPWNGQMITSTTYNSAATQQPNMTAYLNGLCVDSMGKVIATDVGVNFFSNNVPTQQNGIYTTAGKVTMNPARTIAPNGCTFKNNKLCLGQFGAFPSILCAGTTSISGAYTGMNITGGYKNVDGLLYISQLKMLVASTWATASSTANPPIGEGRIMGLKDGATAWMTIASGLSGPADIGYDSKRNLLLVPELLTQKVYTVDMSCVATLTPTASPTSAPVAKTGAAIRFGVSLVAGVVAFSLAVF